MKTTIMLAAITTAVSTIIASDLVQAETVYSVTLGVLSDRLAINEATQVVGDEHIWSDGATSKFVGMVLVEGLM